MTKTLPVVLHTLPIEKYCSCRRGLLSVKSFSALGPNDGLHNCGGRESDVVERRRPFLTGSRAPSISSLADAAGTGIGASFACLLVAPLAQMDRI